MGVSTNAILCFGINIGEDIQDALEKLGVAVSDEPDESEDLAYDLEELLPDCLEIVFTGHPEGCLGYIIAARGSLHASRGYDQEVVAVPTANKQQKAALAKISKQLDIAPALWLASYSDF